MSNIPLTDLRIGNIVKSRPESLVSYAEVIVIENHHYDNTDEYIKVKFDMFGNATSEGWIVQKDIEGIPISEEWLERFGFKLDDTTLLSMKEGQGSYGIRHYTNGSFVICIEYPDDYGYSHYTETDKKLYFIHELMNAWYWITGTELTLKQ